MSENYIFSISLEWNKFGEKDEKLQKIAEEKISEIFDLFYENGYIKEIKCPYFSLSSIKKNIDYDIIEECDKVNKEKIMKNRGYLFSPIFKLKNYSGEIEEVSFVADISINTTPRLSMQIHSEYVLPFDREGNDNLENARYNLNIINDIVLKLISFFGEPKGQLCEGNLALGTKIKEEDWTTFMNPENFVEEQRKFYDIYPKKSDYWRDGKWDDWRYTKVIDPYLKRVQEMESALGLKENETAIYIKEEKHALFFEDVAKKYG
ncbi:hypothetical protein GQ473_06295, partial [archaeon]|nr:hypothetical protein [archaeon]